MAGRANRGRLQKRRSGGNLLSAGLLSFALIFAALLFNRRSTQVEAAVNPAMIVAQYDTIIYPVPVEPVAAGVKIKDIRFRNVAFPKQQVPQGAVQNIDSYLESVTLAALPANLPLFAKNISQTGFNTNPVVDKIPPGMRAMTIRVDATSAVEGWAGSGSTVDVLLVEKNRTSVVAEMVKVLSAERSVSPVEGSAAPSVPSTVTLLVTQEQCLAINTAIPLGRIAFALRSGSDQEKWASTRFTAESLRGGAILKDKKGVITGFVSTTQGGGDLDRGYALSDGKWIETDIVPQGFFDKRIQGNPKNAKD